MTAVGDLIVGGPSTITNWATVANGASVSTVSGTWSGNIANVIDLNDGTFWQSSAHFPNIEFIIDLGVARAVAAFRFFQPAGGGNVTTQFRLESADAPGGPWTERYLSPSGLAGGALADALDTPATARYWRWDAVAGPGGAGCDVRTLELLSAGSPVGTPARLPVGADGHIPYADSSQALGIRWDDPPAGGGGGGGGGGGALVFLGEFSVSNAATLDITGIDNTYDEYELRFVVAPNTDNKQLRVRLSSNGGVSFDSGASDYKYQFKRVRSGTTGFDIDASANAIGYMPVANNVGNAAGECATGVLVLPTLRNTSAYKLMRSDVVNVSDVGEAARHYVVGMRASTSAFNAIRLLFDVGNITGWARLYGVAKTAEIGSIGAYVERSTTQTIPTSTQTAISFDTEVRDDGEMWVVGAPTRLTVPAGAAGWYVVTGNVVWATGSTGSLISYIYVNGAHRVSHSLPPGSNTRPRVGISQVVYLDAGDFVELFVWQNQGSDRATDVADNPTTLSVVRVG